MSITANILMFLLSKVFRVTIRYLTIFNSENHAHTNYFKRDEIWTNCWYRWMGTGNKTDIRYSNRCYADFKWENGKIVEAFYYFDPTGLILETSEE